MIIIIISLTAFVTMLLFPILFSLYFLRKNQEKALEIDQSKVKDPRYFAKSFTGIFDQRWAEYDGSGKITLSREENIVEADGLSVYPSIFHSIVYAENQDFRPPSGISFTKEVYARQNAILYGIKSVRAVCSKKNLVIGNGTRVLRWVDAEGTLTVLNGCDLGISASSNTKITIGDNCTFRRLYAPVIMFGDKTDEEPSDIEHISSEVVEPEVLLRNIKYVNDDLTDDTGVLESSIITIHNITVLDNLTVKGHIRSHKRIKICDNAVVHGNLFAEEDIYLGQNVRVYGLVFTQGNLYTGSGVTVGHPGKIKSVIAKGRIIFEKNCCVYGYVSSEAGGVYSPDYKSRSKYSGVLPSLLFRKENLPNKLLPGAITAAVLIVVIITSISSKSILLKIQEKEMLDSQLTTSKLAYGQDGKPSGQRLEMEPTLVTENHVYFEDRVLERFHYDTQDVIQTSEIISGVMASVPENANKYLMIVPTRIRYEDNIYKLYSDDIDDAIKGIYERMPTEVITIDVGNAFLKYKNEYLYFRTYDTWTALGAYYAAQEFGKRAGFDIRDITEYREHHFKKFYGTFCYLPEAHSIKEYPDYVSYYILEGSSNEQIITARRPGNEYVTYNCPTVAVSRRGYDIFVGTYFSHSILKGDANNSKTLMILGDKFIKPLAPWFTPYYEKVILISPEFFYGDSSDFWNLYSEYEINDLLVIENLQNIGDSRLNKRFRDLFSTPK